MSRSGVGRFFTFAGIGFIVLGALGAAGGGLVGGFMGAGIAGGTFLMIGVIWTLVGIGVQGYYVRVRHRQEAEAQLFETGEKATAVVENVNVTATQINDNPMIDLTLRVRPRNGAEFMHERRLCVPSNGIPLPGHLTEVAYDPSDPTKLALDVDERLAIAPAVYIRMRPPHSEVAAPAAAKPSVIDQLERLQKLREQGALTESEFAAQKARIMLEG